MRIPRSVRLALWVVLFSAACSAATRHYYIAAEDVTWNYAPSGRNLLNGNTIPRPWSQKLEWAKSRFIEYTDDTFTIPKPQPEWLGILGPIIRAEVGDEIVVDFLNRGHRGHDLHPHGLRYDKSNEGSLYLPVAKGAFVAPGARYTYHWFANQGSGPGPGQPSSIVWWYHSHVDPGMEINSGLLGPIVVTAKGKAKPDGSPKDVNREFVASFMIFDEMGGKPAGQLRTGKCAAFDRTTCRDNGVTIRIDVSNCGEALIQLGTRVAQRLYGQISFGQGDLSDHTTFGRGGKMIVDVDQSRKNRLIGKIDWVGTVWHDKAGLDRHDTIVVDDDCTRATERTAGSVENVPSMNGKITRLRTAGQCPKHEENGCTTRKAA